MALTGKQLMTPAQLGTRRPRQGAPFWPEKAGKLRILGDPGGDSKCLLRTASDLFPGGGIDGTFLVVRDSWAER